MKINVTRECIRKGNPSSPDSCPIALALKSHGVPFLGVISDLIETSDFSVDFILPLKAQRFIEDFDTEVKVKPFSFNIPKKVIKNFRRANAQT